MSPTEMPEDAETYVRQLERELQPLPVGDAAKITEEIRSHLLDRAAVGPETLRAAITQLGAPRELGRSFVEDYVLSGALKRGPSWRILLAMAPRALRSLTALAICTAGVLLYALTAGFVLVAILKPITPANVGLWTDASGAHLVDFGAMTDWPRNGHEVLGWWIIPASLFVALLSYLAAAFLMRRGGRLLLKRR
jgi:hypothetical protein